jgi:hypothetical protein
LKDAVVRRTFGQKGPFVYLVPGTSEELPAKDKKVAIADVNLLSEYVSKNSADEKSDVKISKYFYEVEFNKPGGMLMPIIVELTYEDDTKETFKYPAKFGEKIMILQKNLCYRKSD